MNNSRISLIAVPLVSGLLLALLLTFMLSVNAQALSVSLAVPTVTTINPATAPNDLNTSITITGTEFTAVVTQPTVLLNSVVLKDAGWISSTTLTATVPWGLNPGVYTLTVINPDGQNGQLPNAFTVTQGVNVWTTDGPYGGWVGQVDINPGVTTTLYATADNAGVFRSRDSGEHWQRVTAINVIGRPDSPTVFNASFSTIYVGGGSTGWARSADEGDTWASIGWWNGVFTHPVSDTVAYASKCEGGANLGKLYKSEDSGNTWSNAWVTTPITETICEDHGDSWKLAFDPANPLTMYLASANGNIFRSADGGANWTFASRPASAIWSMAVNPFGTHEVWVGTDNRWGDHSTGVQKSANAELTAWTPVQDGGQILEWTTSIRFTPVTWGEAYSGTVYLPYGRRSTDGGATWTNNNNDSFVGGFALDPTNPYRWYTGGNGVHRSLDGGLTWTPMNSGLAAITPNQLAVAPGRPETVYALTDSGLFGSERAGEAWKYLTSIASIKIIAADPFLTSRVYSGKDEGKVYISDDGGQSWPTSGVLTTPIRYSGCDPILDALTADPATPGRLLAGIGFMCGDWSNMGGGLYLSTNSGQSWSYLNATQVISGVNDFLYDPQNPAQVYAGTGGKTGDGVLISTDSGATWQATSNVMTGNGIMSLAAEPAAPYRIYAATQYDGHFVYRSDDQGATWMQMTSSPDNITQHGLVVMPGHPQVLYAATWSGLYWSDDGAQSWHRADGPLGGVHIYSLAVATDGQRAILYVGTAGGMVQLSTTGGMVSVAQQLSAASGETLVSAGVYRMTRLIVYEYIHLPLVRR